MSAVMTMLPSIIRGTSRLDPWGSGPPAELMRLVAPATWSRHQALPVGVEGDDLLIAAPGRAHPELVDELRNVSFREIRVAPVPSDDLELWLEVGIAGRAWEEALTASLARLVRSLGLNAPADARLPEASGRDSPVADVASAFELGEDSALEVLALPAGLPH